MRFRPGRCRPPGRSPMSRSDPRPRLPAVLGATLLATLAGPAAAAPPWHDLGRTLTPEMIASWDIDVRPDGVGLPEGRGSVAAGQVIYDAQCANCHGAFGESNDYIP